MKREESINELKNIALRVRKYIIEMTGAAGSGHPGGALSATEIITFLYFGYMNIEPDMALDKRDIFILSRVYNCNC